MTLNSVTGLILL